PVGSPLTRPARLGRRRDPEVWREYPQLFPPTTQLLWTNPPDGSPFGDKWGTPATPGRRSTGRERSTRGRRSGQSSAKPGGGRAPSAQLPRVAVSLRWAMGQR